MQIALSSTLFVDDGDHHIGGNRDPDLRFDGVRTGAVEVFDSQVLFDPFEEEFDAPLDCPPEKEPTKMREKR